MIHVFRSCLVKKNSMHESGIKGVSSPRFGIDTDEIEHQTNVSCSIDPAHLRFPDTRPAADGDDFAVLHHVRVHLLHRDLQGRKHSEAGSESICFE